MSKRTAGTKRERDFWPTKDFDAVRPLLPHIESMSLFDEPCCGDGSLIKILHEISGHVACSRATDIKTSFGVNKCLFDLDSCHGDCFITNPPWTWEILKEIIPHLSDIAPTWLLLNADLSHNKRMGGFMRERCRKVVSVGRVSWMGNGKKGFENAAWYLFDKPSDEATIFYGRVA